MIDVVGRLVRDDGERHSAIEDMVFPLYFVEKILRKSYQTLSIYLLGLDIAVWIAWYGMDGVDKNEP